MSKSGAWATVVSTADEQWGLVTKPQAEATGLAWSTLARQVRNGVLERVAHGVYRIRGAGFVDHLELRAAWLQLNPSVPAWEREPADGVVSHRSAADLLGEREDAGAVAQLIADALRARFDYPDLIARAIAPHAAAYGLHRDDGLALLDWLLTLSGDPNRDSWLAEAAKSHSN